MTTQGVPTNLPCKFADWS